MVGGMGGKRKMEEETGRKISRKKKVKEGEVKEKRQENKGKDNKRGKCKKKSEGQMEVGELK